MGAPAPRYVGVAVAITSAVVLVGTMMSSSGSTAPPSPPTPTDLPLEQVRLTNVDVARAPFCAVIPDKVITQAVGGSATATEYTNGERTDLEPNLTDIAHEYGCTFTHGGTEARVWIFAAPLSAEGAIGLVKEEQRADGCADTGVIEFGSPGAVVVCTTEKERVLRAVGLMRTTWVHCELGGSLAKPERRLVLLGQRWCVDVINAIRQGS